MTTREELTAALASSGLPAWLTAWTVRVSKARTRTAGAAVEPSGLVVFTVPASAGTAAAVTAVHGMLDQVRERLNCLAVRTLANGEGFHLFGTSYRLKLVHDGPAAEIRRCPLGQRRPGDDVNGSMGSAKFLCLRRDAARPRILVDWYATQLREYAPARIAEYAQRLGIDTPGQLEIRTGGRPWRKWGTYLHTVGLITLNWQLAQVPRRLVDYILAHEVAHAATPGEKIRKGHGPRWEAALTRVMPDWKRRRDELNELAASLWTGHVAAGAEDTAKDAVRAEQFAAKFAADTLLCSFTGYTEPTDEAFTRVFAGCVKPPAPALYPLIRDVFTHRYPQPATPAAPVLDEWDQLAATLSEVNA